MRKLFKKARLNNKGFSLAEITIVLVIIAAIMGLIVPKIQDGMVNSKIKNTKLRMTDVDTKISEYEADCKKLPATLDFLIADVSDCPNWTSNKKNKAMLKDEWQNDLSYEVHGNGYILKSFGADKKEGGSGPDKDFASEGSESSESKE